LSSIIIPLLLKAKAPEQFSWTRKNELKWCTEFSSVLYFILHLGQILGTQVWV